MIRLIALDLDQTLFGNDLVVSARVKSAISAAQRTGAIVTIVTGREAPVTTRFARELNITSPIICTQGACIYDQAQDRMLRKESLSPELLPRLIHAGNHHGWNYHFEMSGRLYLPAKSNHPPAFFELLRYSEWCRVDDLLGTLTNSPHKMVVTLDRTEDRRRVIQEMTAAFGTDVTIVPSHPFLVEALPAGVDKGHALAWLAEHLNISQAEVMAIGDSEADIPMIAWAGMGVAMSNGSAAARAAANWVAPSLDEDGAAIALEKFVLPAGVNVE